MAIQFGCQCGQAMTVRDEFAGKQIRCPQCDAVLSVPGVGGSQSSGGAGNASGSPVAGQARTGATGGSGVAAAPGLPPIQPPVHAQGIPQAGQSTGQQLAGGATNVGAGAGGAGGTVDVRHLPPVQAWAFAGAADFTLITLTRDALWIGDKNEVDLQNLTSYLNGGGDPMPVFAERGIRIDLSALLEAEANKHGKAVDVQYQLGDQRAISHLDFANQVDRNVFFSSMQARLGNAVVMETEQVPAWKAGIKPMAWACFVMFITLMFYLGAQQLISGESEAEIRGNKKFLKLIAYWIIDLIGPNGVLIVGALFVIGCVVWFVRRAQQPPILVRLKRAKG